MNNCEKSKKYQIVTYNQDSGYDEKLDYTTLKEAREHLKDYNDYNEVFIINKRTKQRI